MRHRRLAVLCLALGLSATASPMQASASESDRLLAALALDTLYLRSESVTSIAREAVRSGGRTAAIAAVSKKFSIESDAANALLDAALLAWSHEAGGPDPVEAEVVIAALERALAFDPERLFPEVGALLDPLATREPAFASRLAGLLADPPSDRNWIQELEERSSFESREEVLDALLERSAPHPIVLAEASEDVWEPVWAAAILTDALARLDSFSETPSEELVAGLRSRQLAALLAAGLLDEALAVLDALPQDIETAIFTGAPERIDTRFAGWSYRSEKAANEDLRPLLGAALLSRGEVSRARRLLAAMRDFPPTTEEAELLWNRGHETERELFSFALTPSSERADSFDLFERTLGISSDSFQPQNAAALMLAAELAREEGYPQIERQMLERARWSLGGTNRSLEDARPSLPASVHAEARRLRAQVDDLRTLLIANVRERKLVRHEAEPAPFDHRFEALAVSKFRHELRDESPTMEIPPGALTKGFQPVTVARGEGRLGIVAGGPSLARDETDLRGYWLFESGDAGLTWQAPRYLGLIVGAIFHLHGTPARYADDRLRLDATRFDQPPSGGMIRWIDMDNPPKRGVLSLDLGPVREDRDGDGLTDLVERHLLTDPETRDTDGDGIDDGEDRRPLWPGEGEAAETTVAEAFRVGVERAFGPQFTRGAGSRSPSPESPQAFFLAVDSAPVEALTPNARLVVLGNGEPFLHSEGGADVLGGRGAKLSRITFFEVDHERRRAFIGWSTSRESGSALLVRDENGWRASRGVTHSGCVVMQFDERLEEQTGEEPTPPH